MTDSQIKAQRRIKNLHKANNVFFWIVVALAVVNTFFLIFVHHKPWNEIVFRFMQYVAMLIVLKLPFFLKKRFRIEVPWVLSTLIVLFSFSAFVLGDGLDFYGKYTWWDSVLHAESGVLLSLVAFWLVHAIMAENDKYIYLNKYFMFLFILMFSVGMGACWEILEYTYDSIAGTNSQQFMASTTGSIITPEDIPLCGHAALRDTMSDIILNFFGALAVAIYGFINHKKSVTAYQRYKELFEPEDISLDTSL